MRATDAELFERANAFADARVAESFDGASAVDFRAELARAFVVGYAAGAEDQAGVISSRPLSPAVIRRRR